MAPTLTIVSVNQYILRRRYSYILMSCREPTLTDAEWEYIKPDITNIFDPITISSSDFYNNLGNVLYNRGCLPMVLETLQAKAKIQHGIVVDFTDLITKLNASSQVILGVTE